MSKLFFPYNEMVYLQTNLLKKVKFLYLLGPTTREIKDTLQQNSVSQEVKLGFRNQSKQT